MVSGTGTVSASSIAERLEGLCPTEYYLLRPPGLMHFQFDQYPDQIDGFERLGQVYVARGVKQIAADYYQKAADFAKTAPGFEQESVEYYLSKAKKRREEKK